MKKIPNRRRKALNITLAPDVREALEAFAIQQKRPISGVVEEVLRDMLKAHGWLNYTAPAHHHEDIKNLQIAAERPPGYGTQKSA